AEVGDLRDLLAGPARLADAQGLAAPVALEDDDPVVRRQDAQRAEPLLRLADPDVGLVALDLAKGDVRVAELGALLRLVAGRIGALGEQVAIDLRSDDLVARVDVGVLARKGLRPFALALRQLEIERE